MADFNSPGSTVILKGNVVRDVEPRVSAKGTRVATMTLAVTGYSEQVNFLDVVLFNDLAEKSAEATKGRFVVVTGYLQRRTYKDKNDTNRYVVETVADSLYLGKSPDNQEQPMTQAQALNGGKDFVVEDFDDKPIDLSEIPF